MSKVEIGHFSDTHNHHESVKLKPCDVLCFSGDFSGRGSEADTESFLKWFTIQDADKRILVAGNHDLCFDWKFDTETHANKWLLAMLQDYGANNKFIYLQNRSLTTHGLNFWGSAITPDFFPQHWAFNAPRGNEIAEVWSKIPDNTDVIITHGPPRYIGDFISSQHKNVGCEDLMKRIKEISPKAVLFGHIHDGAGRVEKDGTIYLNSAICDEEYRPVNDPQYLTFEI